MRWLENLDRRRLAIAGLVLGLVCFVAINIFGALDLRRTRLDLTENGEFTLSDATRDFLRSMEEPVTLRLYVSRGVREASPLLATYADRVHDLLKTYAQESGGLIDLRLIDPEPFSVEEDRAVGFGLQAIPLEGGGANGYLGIAGTNSTDDADVIPVLSPEREQFLEYDLTRLVYNLANPEKPVVAMISGLPLQGDPANQYQPWQVYQQLSQFFDVRFLGGDIKKLDEDVDLLLIVQPGKLSDTTLFTIDQFVLGGGRTMVFVDPHSEAAAMRSRSQTPPQGPSSSDLERLFAAWGIEMVPGKVVADPRYAREVQVPSSGRQQVVPYLAWLAATDQALSRTDPITAELERLTFATAGILGQREGATTTLEPLVRSSSEAQAIDVDRVALYPDPMKLIQDYTSGGESLVMAARITGEVGSAFEGELPEGVEAGEERLERSTGPVSLIVVADTDLLDDRNWLASQSLFGRSVSIPIADNANFVANALDFLAGSETLASLRGREVAFRPFTKVAELRRAAEQAYRAKEQELQTRLGELQQKLSSLEVGNGEEGVLLTAEQKAEVEGFRTQLLETRRELRDTRHALRQDIEELRDRLRFLNIVAVPILVALAAIGLALIRRSRFRRRLDANA